MALLAPEQVQSLTESLQVLTDEEKQYLTSQQTQQQHLNWLIRQNELQTDINRHQQALQAALQAQEDAQPQLAALNLALPAGRYARTGSEFRNKRLPSSVRARRFRK